jgi:hypothetical protein
MEKCIIGVLHENSHLNLGSFVKNMFWYAKVIIIDGIIYLQACLCHVIYFHDTVSPEVGFQVSFWSKTEQYDRFCAFKGVDLGYPKIFPSKAKGRPRSI